LALSETLSVRAAIEEILSQLREKLGGRERRDVEGVEGELYWVMVKVYGAIILCRGEKGYSWGLSEQQRQRFLTQTSYYWVCLGLDQTGENKGK